MLIETINQIIKSPRLFIRSFKQIIDDNKEHCRLGHEMVLNTAHHEIAKLENEFYAIYMQFSINKINTILIDKNDYSLDIINLLKTANYSIISIGNSKYIICFYCGCYGN